MKFHSEYVVKKARKLRRKGLSGREIGRRLNVGDSTVLTWCSDIPSKNSYHLYIQKLKKEAKKRSSGLTKKMRITKETAKLLTSL